MSMVDHDPVIICPYDSNHKIAKSRIQRHLVKCEKNFPPDFRKQCPYDATHRVSPHQLIDHVKDCPMKYMYPIDFGQSIPIPSDVTMQIENKTNNDDDDDAWDEDLPDPSTVSSLDEQFPSHHQRFQVRSYRKELRRPLGRSESLMLENTDDDTQSEISDVHSSTGVGTLGRARSFSGQYQRGNMQQRRVGIRGRLPPPLVLKKRLEDF